jgi:rare lipoprotein A
MLYHARVRDDAGRTLGLARTLPGLCLVVAWALCAAAVAAAAGAADLPSAPYPFAPGGLSRPVQTGIASAYRDRLDGHATASGEPYNRNALTAAHRSLPLGTLVKVTNVDNRRVVIVRINDRGPAVGNRLIELTPRAAAAVGLVGISTAPVKLEIVGTSAPRVLPPAGDLVPDPPVK